MAFEIHTSQQVWFAVFNSCPLGSHGRARRHIIVCVLQRTPESTWSTALTSQTRTAGPGRGGDPPGEPGWLAAKPGSAYRSSNPLRRPLNLRRSPARQWHHSQGLTPPPMGLPRPRCSADLRAIGIRVQALWSSSVRNKHIRPILMSLFLFYLKPRTFSRFK